MQPRIVRVAGVLAVVTSMVVPVGVRAADTDAADIRAQAGRFWMIAEDQVRTDVERRAAVPQPEVSCTVVQPSCGCRPAPVYPRPSCRGCQPPTCGAPPVTIIQTPPPARPSVEVNQSAGSSKHRGDWGLELLGSVPVFRFTWGDDDCSRTDSLRGNL